MCEGGEYYENSVLSAHFFCTYKTVLKKKTNKNEKE